MKKILPAAVLAALAGVNAAQAVHVNPDGTGEVLVFPFYTVEGGQDTYINLVNTTNQSKAVKIRFIESMNSVEVLDFNIYLSPEDHWSAVITANESGGASVRSADNTCTVPNSIGNGVPEEFRDFLYQSDTVKGPARTREGYVEVIDMGTVIGDDYTSAIEHSAGTPGDCVFLSDAWAPNGSWTNSQGSDGMTASIGGLYGYGVLINVEEGTDATYDAVALDDWSNEIGPGFIHTAPRDLLPSIVSGTSLYEVFDSGGIVAGEAVNGRDAVSATMMQSSIANDYVLETDISASTSWVVTFPTKRFYIQGVVAQSPFTTTWSSLSSSACESVGVVYWDREEGTESVDPSDFSPPRPDDDPSSFCYEANVLTFNGTTALAPSARTLVNVDLEDGFENGWARVNFEGEGRFLDTFDHTFYGLPAVGFAVQQYVNGDVNGVLSNYQGSDLHKGARNITSVED